MGHWYMGIHKINANIVTDTYNFLIVVLSIGEVINWKYLYV